MSRFARSPHLGPALGALALVVAAVALVVTLTRGDPKAPDLARRIEPFAEEHGGEVQAHLTNPPRTTRVPNWDLFAVAICLRT